jgi:Fic family protein
MLASPTDMEELTPRQERILEHIRRTVQDRGYPPTVREIGEAVGLTSSSRVHAQLANLQRKGLLRKDAAKPRAIEVAGAAKLEDTYHSTTIEGYRITREEVRAVLEGVPYEGRTPDEIVRLMALKGYSHAFDQTLEMVRKTFGGQKLSESMIFDLHLELWGPSIDAGIVEAADMRGWRESPVFIRRSRYVPPGPEKVDRYMAQLVEQVNGLEVGPITRASCTHWGFVHIHPFMDGNGRLARLLMNYMLAASGFPWTTIRAEERPVYFRALEQAHIDDDFRPLAEFLRDDVMRSWELHS